MTMRMMATPRRPSTNWSRPIDSGRRSAGAMERDAHGADPARSPPGGQSSGHGSAMMPVAAREAQGSLGRTMSDHIVPSRFARSGSTVRFDHGASPVTLTVCTSRIVRVELADERDAAGPSHFGPRGWAAVPFGIIDGERVRLSTGDLRVEAATSPVRLTFLDAAGAWLLREPAHGGMITESLGDTRRRVRASFEFSDEQHFYGLGQGGLQLDRLGTARQLWNTHIGHGPGSDMGIPLLISNRGYALFFDNTSDAMLSVGRSDGGVRITYTAEAGRLVWYFLIGPDLRR